MRITIARISVTLISIAATMYGAVDLTPAVTDYVAEGIRITQLNFKDGDRKITYEPPFAWTYRGGGSSLELTPAKASRAEASIEAARSSSKEGLTDTVIEAAKQQFLASLPPQAEAVTIVSEQQNALLLNNHPTYQIVASYKFLGENFVRSALISDVEGTQFTFKLTARKADFDKLDQTFRSSVLSLRWHATPEPAKAAADPAVAIAK